MRLLKAALVAIALLAPVSAQAASVNIPVSPRFVQAMSVLYPTASSHGGYLLAGTSDAPTLISWNLPGDPPTTAQITAALASYDWQQYQATARAAMQATDVVALRCFKAGVPYPAEWRTYYLALRAILSATNGDPAAPLPARPAFPAGT